MLTAGVAAGLLLVFLLPTFNALNNSYVQNVKPPPWVTPPSQYPDVTPPDMTPPDMTPPTNIPSHLPPPPKDGRIPPGVGGCPGARIVTVVDNATFSIPPGGSSGFSQSFALSNKTVYLEGYVNFTSWQAQSVAADLSGPAGFQSWNDGQAGAGGIFPQSTASTSFHYQSYNNQTGGSVPPPGSYTVTASWASPAFSGTGQIYFAALVCGGAAR